MPNYVYRRNISESATLLADALGFRRWRDQRTPLTTRATTGDRVISWGEQFAKAGVLVLNGGALRSKLTDAEVLAAAGVPTIAVSRTRPVVTPVEVPAGPDPAVAAFNRAQELAEDFVEEEVGTTVNRSAPRIRGVEELSTAFSNLLTAMRTPAPVATTTTPTDTAEWLGRSSSHVGGTDLMRNNASDYFVRKEQLTREFRVHSFLGRSIHAGVKVPRPGFANPHAWIRSYDGGWMISYDGDTVRQAHRDLAHRAIEALGLDFGAVDIGEKADGTLIVLEVNRAPGIEGGTLAAYTRAIGRWTSGEWATRQPVRTDRPATTARRRPRAA